MPQHIIIGAGMSGLACAAALESKDFIVLEARNRIGGRMLTVPGPIGPADLGAAWLHDVPANPLFEVAEAAGLKAKYDDTATALYATNAAGNALSDSELEDLCKLQSEFDDWRRTQPENSLEQALASFAAERVSSLPNFERALQLLEETLQFQQLPNGLCWGALSSHYEQGPEGGRDMVLEGGYAQILDVVAANVDRSQIRLGAAVKTIAYHPGGGVQVTLESGEQIDGCCAVVTVPVMLLKANKIEFQPPLAAPIQAALDSTLVASIGKVYLEFDKVFWPDNTFKFVMLGPRPALVHNYYAVHGRQRKVLCFLLCTEALSEAEADPENAWNVVKPLAERFALPGATIPAPVKTMVTRWNTDPWTMGAHSAYETSLSRAEAAAAFAGSEPPLLFAGEHTAVVGATAAHGAYLSGRRAANAANQYVSK